MDEIIITQTVSPKNYCKYEHTMCEFANDRGYCLKTGCTKRIIVNEVPKVNKNLVEVVRCKDCRWHEREQPGMVYCPNTVGNWVEDDWYCKGGERRGEEDDNM